MTQLYRLEFSSFNDALVAGRKLLQLPKFRFSSVSVRRMDEITYDNTGISSPPSGIPPSGIPPSGCRAYIDILLILPSQVDVLKKFVAVCKPRVLNIYLIGPETSVDIENNAEVCHRQTFLSPCGERWLYDERDVTTIPNLPGE